MRIVRKDADALNTTIELTIEPADYLNEFEQQLKKVKNQAQIKGFRKGMVPTPMLKKMYGKSVFTDVINELIQKNLFDYIDAEKLKYIGQPLPNKEENTIVDLDINDKTKEYSFSFDLGLLQDFEVKGVDTSDTYTYYDVEIPESIVEREMFAIQRQFGKQITVTEDIDINDMLKLEANELDGDNIKVGGHETDFSVLVDIIHDKEMKDLFLTKKVGDELDINIFNLEDKTKAHINKYILKLPEDAETGEMYRVKINEINRIEPAPLDQEFFDKLGADITDVEGFRAFVYKDIKSYYDTQATNYMNREIMDALMENNKIELPELFLKRYLKETNENVTSEVIEAEYEAFAKNMRWTLIKGELVRAFEVQVAEADIRKSMTDSVLSFMYKYGQLDPTFIDSTVNRLMEDKEQVNKVFEELQADKLFQKINESVQKLETKISYDDFSQKVKELNESLNKMNA